MKNAEQAESARAFVETRNTRTGEPRKVDEWKIRLPDGSRASFDVRMGYHDDMTIFSLRSESPHFTGCRLVHSDLNALKKMLSDWAAEVIEREISADWAPAMLAETRVRRRETRQSTQFTFDLTLERIEHMPDTRPGNRGETVIRDRVGQRTIVQRALADDFSDCNGNNIKGDLRSDAAREYFNSPFRGEHGDPVSRVVTEDFEAADKLLNAIEAFSLLLAERLSRQSVRDLGVPKPEDLAAIMNSAVAGMDVARAVPLRDDEFLM